MDVKVATVCDPDAFQVRQVYHPDLAGVVWLILVPVHPVPFVNVELAVVLTNASTWWLVVPATRVRAAVPDAAELVNVDSIVTVPPASSHTSTSDARHPSWVWAT